MDKQLQWKTIKYATILIFFVFGLLAILLIAPQAHGFTIMADSNVYVEKEVFDDLYSAGTSIVIDNTVGGDINAAAQSLDFNSLVTGDLNIAAQFINIRGEIKDDIRAAGQRISIDNLVGGDVVGFGQNIILGSNSQIEQDVMLIGKTIEIYGKINGNGIIKGEKIIIGGVIEGDVDIQAKIISFQGNGLIMGNLKYSTPLQQANIKQFVTGAIQYEPLIEFGSASTPTDFKNKIYHMLSGYVIWSFFASLLILSIIGFYVYPFFKPMGEMIQNNYLQALGLGWLILIVGFVSVLLLLVTVIGIQLGFVLLGLLMLFLFLGDVFVAVLATSFCLQKYKNVSKLKFIIYSFLLLLLVHIISIIPVVDVIVWALTIPATLGILTLFKKECYYKLIGKKK
jgi:hypothetical protein